MYKKTPLSIEVKKVLKLLIYTLLVMLFAATGYFLLKLSNNSEKGYLLRENQFLQKDLESENRILKQRVLDAQSLKEIQKSDIADRMNVQPQPTYIRPMGPLTKRK